MKAVSRQPLPTRLEADSAQLGYTQTVMLCVLAFVMALAVTPSFSIGIWQRPAKSLQKGDFSISFILLKAGVFSSVGHLTETPGFSKALKSCDGSPPIEAWVTHRLFAGETLSVASAHRLAQGLNRLLVYPCIRAVELDVEPIERPLPWLLSFLSQVRASLNPQIRLRMAVPLVSSKTVVGLRWNAEQAGAVLSIIDGIDVMAYDTGVRSAESYRDLITGSVGELVKLVNRWPSKEITLGLPAYYDNTRLHDARIESLENAFEAIQTVERPAVCHPGIRFCVYAGWTLRAQDQATVRQFSTWRSNVCKK